MVGYKSTDGVHDEAGTGAEGTTLFVERLDKENRV
jgi:hypothetical protein